MSTLPAHLRHDVCKMLSCSRCEPQNQKRGAFMRSSRIRLRFAYAICAIAALELCEADQGIIARKWDGGST
jgi:hypothetical protein